MSRLFDWLSKHQIKFDYVLMACALITFVATAINGSWTISAWALVAFSQTLRLVTNDNNYSYHTRK